MHASPLMRGLLVLLLALSISTIAFAVGEWTLVKHDGRDYVTLENVGQFYQVGPLRQASNGFELRNGFRSLHGQFGSPEFYINGLKFILSYPVAEAGGHSIVSRMDLTKLIEPVLRPSRIRNAELVNTIVLDPGHGGSDCGATSVYGNEKTFALDVALRARDMLKFLGFKVYMTRSSDVLIPLEERAKFANRFPKALFIAIHFNSGGDNATGVETYTLAPRGVPSMAADGPALSDFVPCPGNVCDAENIALACATHSALVRNSGLFDRGIKRARFVVIRDITVPGVLIECGFLSSNSDARKIALPMYRQQLALAIVQAVRNYRNAVGTQPPMLVNSENDPSIPRNVPIVVTPSTVRKTTTATTATP